MSHIAQFTIASRRLLFLQMFLVSWSKVSGVNLTDECRSIEFYRSIGITIRPCVGPPILTPRTCSVISHTELRATIIFIFFFIWLQDYGLQ